MNDETERWVDKAEGDYEGAELLAKKKSNKTAHLICLACQQSAEKYLKAFLVENNVRFSKTHALVRELLPLCRTLDDEFKILTSFLSVLDPYAVEFRYPGDTIPLTEVRASISAIRKIRKFVRGKLGLEKQQRLL
ncbi:MAG: HEPN domain-containing protein [Ignavibacteriae bacterium]|nr:HEPN domain-containing protein [Ignavibacteriota bacterium]